MQYIRKYLRHIRNFLYYEIQSFFKSDIPRLRGKFFIFIFNILPAPYCLKHIRNLSLKLSGIKMKINDNYFKGKIFSDAPHNIYLKDGYMNYNVSFEGGGKIIIGKNHKIGPNVTFVTSDHSELQTKNYDIIVGDNVWIGAGAIIIGGAVIGDNVIIGAGSVVPRGKYFCFGKYAGNPARSLKNVNISDENTIPLTLPPPPPPQKQGFCFV